MLQFFQNFSRSLLGKKLNPLNAETRHAVALAAFLAWVGLGADGLSSSAYGPEEAFKALGEHTFLGFYLAIATALTVIIISISYNQIIELFPNGGGGYRIASQLIHPVAGLTSGAALLVDYVLTIAISVASGIDALFSLLDPQWQFLKLPIEEVMMVLLLWINLRGAKESIKILLPIFMSFVVLHIALIVYGVGVKSSEIPQLVSTTWQQTTTMASNSEIGWLGIFFLFMKAYSMGGGTYTGIEAVSNNVQSLAEPRVANGKRTTWYMAISLAFTSGGIILLYLLWHTHHQAGQTLNAIMSQQVLAHLGFSSEVSLGVLTAILLSEAGLLMVAANTGFLGGPAVLANMAQDSWVPHQFRYLSSRLVTQNGVIVMGLSAMLILWASSGSVAWLVVLYSINVFLTFSLSLLGVCRYWISHRHQHGDWWWRLFLSGLGLIITLTILTMTIITKFLDGGWMTLLITSTVILFCYLVKRHYEATKQKIKAVDEAFASIPMPEVADIPELDYEGKTAVFIVGSSKGGGLHAMLWVQRMFPNYFKNFVFVKARTVDARSFGGQEELAVSNMKAREVLTYFEQFCHGYGLAAKSYIRFGIDPIDELYELSQQVQKDFPDCIFFTSKLIMENENFFTRWLHNQAPTALQRRLHLSGQQMVILPMKI